MRSKRVGSHMDKDCQVVQGKLANIYLALLVMQEKNIEMSKQCVARPVTN